MKDMSKNVAGLHARAYAFVHSCWKLRVLYAKKDEMRPLNSMLNNMEKQKKSIYVRRQDNHFGLLSLLK